MKAVAPDWSLYLRLTDELSIALSYLYDTLRLFLQTIARGKHGGTNIAYWPSLNTVHERKAFAPFTVDWPCNSNTPSLWFNILIDSLQEHQFCSSYKEVQEHECRSLVAKCWHSIKSVQSFCCWQWSPQLGDIRLPTHSMECVLLHTLYWVGPQSGDSYAELWKWMSYKQLATTTFAIVWLFLWG